METHPATTSTPTTETPVAQEESKVPQIKEINVHFEPVDPPAETKDVITMSKERIAHLETINEVYFKKDRNKVIKTHSDDIVRIIDSKNLEFEKNKKERAQLMYLKGKALDFLPEFSK